MKDLENNMAFQDAVDAMERLGFNLKEIAAALGFSHQYVRAMRVWSLTAKGRRNVPPPETWRPALREMARLRASALMDLVENHLGVCGNPSCKKNAYGSTGPSVPRSVRNDERGR